MPFCLSRTATDKEAMSARSHDLPPAIAAFASAAARCALRCATYRDGAPFDPGLHQVPGLLLLPVFPIKVREPGRVSSCSTILHHCSCLCEVSTVQ